MIRVLYGNEPYFMERLKTEAVSKVSVPEFNLAEFYEWGGDILSCLATYPVMEDTKTVLLYLDDIKGLDGTGKGSFMEYVSHPAENADLLVFLKNVDKRSSLYRKLKGTGILEECSKAGVPALQEIVAKEVQRLGGRITKEAFDELMKREQYFELEEISILNIISDVRRLVSYSNDITPESVKLCVRENIAGNVFGIARMILENDSAELKRQAEVLSGNVIGTLSALLREYRIGYKCRYFKPSETGAKYVAMRGIETEKLVSGMDIIMSSIDGIKAGSLMEGQALWFTFQKLLAMHSGRLDN